jgi:altronate dehydratase small subunit
MVHAIKLHDSDNVASVFDLVEANSTVLVVDKKGNSYELKVLGKIPYGHKIAIEKIEVGQQVTKYGEEIGLATSVINIGEHVHVHNIESIRGRGDWAKAESDQGAAK